MAEIEKDDLLADVRAADAELNAPDPIVDTPQAPPESAEDKAERVRDEQGRFAKAEAEKVSRETLKLKPKETPAELPTGSEAKPQDPAAQPSQAPTAAGSASPEPIPPPPDWKGDAKVRWGRVPPEIQAEIRDRYQSIAQAQAAMAPVEQALAPWRDTLIRDAGSVESGVSQLMEFYKLFLENPQGLIHHIARTRGIDIGQPQGQPTAPAGSPPAAPDINSLVSQAVQQAFAPIQEQIRSTETQQIVQTLDQFRLDPKHPYFEDVRVTMGRLINAGLAQGLPDAYEQAVKLNPTIWSALEAQRTEEAKGSQAAAAEKARKAAAASVRGSPLPNGQSGSTSQTSSVLDDVRAADAELSGA